ncbi:unnamed protein product [Enterobius vermicularis]|uniref:Rab-GAP TBC domain-containing protein n=1 Tax=Enterobius vermicularis TaxID=51028 RepID=A0A0N4VB21_ENTVE|nr:unnamed protein product [Enterobius vermicularis]
MTSKYKERLAQLERILLLQNSVINIDELRRICENGIDEKFRPLCWRILLGYMPLERDAWADFLKKQRETYDAIVEEIIVAPGQALSLCSNNWKKYFKDNEVLLQIDKDVRRLCPEIEFFQKATNFPHRKRKCEFCWFEKTLFGLSMKNPEKFLFFFDYLLSLLIRITFQFIPSPSKVAKNDYTNEILCEGAEYHWQVVERILFVYSKLNPGVKYVQGMNEIVGPLYYVFSNDNNTEWTQFAEADTYYCFQILMSEIKDNFIKTLDNSNCGITWVMSQFCERLRICDHQLYDHLVSKLAVKPQFFAFRWLSLLLSQEFPLPDVIIIWDSVFSASNRINIVQWICIAVLQRERQNLLNGDFSSCLRLLQDTVPEDHKKFRLESASRFATAFANKIRSLAKK